MRAGVVGKCCNRVERSAGNGVAGMLGYSAVRARDTIRSVLLAGVEGDCLRVHGDVWSDGARTTANAVVGKGSLLWPLLAIRFIHTARRFQGPRYITHRITSVGVGKTATDVSAGVLLSGTPWLRRG